MRNWRQHRCPTPTAFTTRVTTRATSRIPTTGCFRHSPRQWCVIASAHDIAANAAADAHAIAPVGHHGWSPAHRPSTFTTRHQSRAHSVRRMSDALPPRRPCQLPCHPTALRCAGNHRPHRTGRTHCESAPTLPGFSLPQLYQNLCSLSDSGKALDIITFSNEWQLIRTAERQGIMWATFADAELEAA